MAIYNDKTWLFILVHSHVGVQNESPKLCFCGRQIVLSSRETSAPTPLSQLLNYLEELESETLPVRDDQRSFLLTFL